MTFQNASGVWTLCDWRDAEAAYYAWKDAIPSGIRGYFADLTRAIDNWRTEVFNYFDHRVTNAYTESANNHIKSIAAQGRGYSFDVLRARVLFIGAKHKIRPKPFKQGIAEKSTGIGYALPDDLFCNYGVEFQHEAENSYKCIFNTFLRIPGNLKHQL